MNNLEEIQEFIRNFVYDKKEIQSQIVEIEEKRTQLAQERNELKKVSTNNNVDKINALGNEIAQLGNQSQELQNKLDSRFNEVKSLVNLSINNLITESIRKIRRMEEEKQDLVGKIEFYNEKNAKYEFQKQEFYERFGRLPELSENAIEEISIQEKQNLRDEKRVEEIQSQLEKVETEMFALAHAKKEFENKNWKEFEEFKINEEVYIEELEPIEEMQVEELNVEELIVEEFKQPEERFVLREFKVFGTEDEESFEVVWAEQDVEKPVEKTVDVIEELAKSIVEEIAAEQTKDLNINKVKVEENVEEIIAFEKNEEDRENVESVKEKVIISNIIAKIEDGEVVYKAQISNGDEIRVYPTKTNTGNLLIKYKEKRVEFESILVNYAIANNNDLDEKAIRKIDPTICEILVEFANKYDYDVQNLIYNYAMSFSRYEEYDEDIIPVITYNLSYTSTLGTVLNKKEKAAISKICKDARRNQKIDMVGYVTKFNQIRYVLKRIFASNKIKALSEGKY